MSIAELVIHGTLLITSLAIIYELITAKNYDDVDSN
jgi:hypothetical protein